jgi:hypothetical protein
MGYEAWKDFGNFISGSIAALVSFILALFATIVYLLGAGKFDEYNQLPEGKQKTLYLIEKSPIVPFISGAISLSIACFFSIVPALCCLAVYFIAWHTPIKEFVKAEIPDLD